MTVKLQSPYKGQQVGTLYTGSEEAALVAAGLASLLPTTARGVGPAAAMPDVQLAAPYQGFGVGAIYKGADRASVVAQGLGFFLGTVSAGTPGGTPTPTPTPAPSFTSQPSISPSSGTAGQTFTGTNGTVSNGSVTGRRWLLSGTAIGTGTTVVPATAGSLVLENTATGTDGSTITATSAAVTVAAPAPGANATTFAITPTAHYHAPTATVTNYSDAPAAVGDRIKGVVDRRGLADIVGPGAGGNPGTSANAPILDVDALGRKFLNFRDGAWSAIADTLANIDGRAVSIIAMYRAHKGGGYNIFWPRYSAASTVNTNRTGALALTTPVSDARHSYPCMGQNFLTMGAQADATNKRFHVQGSQCQVVGVRANASNAMYRTNGKTATSTAAPSLGTGRFGGILGGQPNLANGATVDTARGMSLYELVVFNRVLTDVEFNAACDAMQANWAISDFTKQEVIEGNSVSEGTFSKGPPSTNGVRSDGNVAMLMSAPGQPRAGWRVVNVARGGSTIGTAPADNGQNNALYRKDLADSMYDQTLPGGAANNVVSYQDGTNDWVTISGADAYTAYKNIINSPSTGYLQRGWGVKAIVPIARASTGTTYTACQAQRSAMVANLIADTQAGPGQAYDGLVKLIRLDLATVSGSTVFLTDTDTQNPTYYQQEDTAFPATDRVHPSGTVPGGTTVMYTGGDNAAQGYGANL